MLEIKEYVRVKTLEEAYELNQKKRNVIIGGMHWLKMSKAGVGTAIDLSGLGLDKITETDAGFEIGCMVSLRDLELHEGLNTYTNGAVKDAVKDIVGVQFRNTATVGGSIYGRFGFSDVLTVFLAMEAYVECYNAGIIPLDEFAKMKADRDILVKLIVKKVPLKIAYMAQRHARTDFPILACGVGITEGKIRVAVGARPYKASVVLCDFLEDLNEDTVKDFAENTAKEFKYGSNMRASGEYREKIAKVLIKRALLKAGGAK